MDQMELMEIEALLELNDDWLVHDFGEWGFFIGPKYIADTLEYALEEM